MILGWDDQKRGGIEKSLVGTGLLDKQESSLPSCYVYKYTEGSTNSAIVGWSTGFEDGGPRVKDRKFPVMFFDRNVKFSWGWVSAKSLSEFPLYKPDPPKKEDDPFNSARRWIAKKEGFSSWDEFEETRKEKAQGAQEMRGGFIPTPLVSPITDAGNCSHESDAEGPARSSISNVTEKELQDMQNTAGEIDGDSDYSNSDEDSTLEVWKQPEDEGRPWAFYGLRNAENTKTGPAQVSPVHTAQSNDPNHAEGVLSTISHASTDVLNTSLPSVADLGEDLKGMKRARSEDKDEMIVDIPRQDNAKKAKLDVDTSDNQADNSAVSERDPTPVSPVPHSFLPRVPLGPAAFELSFFSKGPLSWNRESEASPIGLYYGEGNRMVSTADGPVKIVIDPTTLRGFIRDEIPGSNGNSTMTLLAKNSSDASVKVVFDRARGSKVDIGKIQVRSFIRWLRSINPAVRLLEG
ncbi:hypothetical protein E0Z10_g7108 [Xylaria hypoxylon]|uniref:Uncharacterized protein n=1 Tax=Xylaria hypoxylon TaxID=37992 RepID=A0A4Z0YBS4_9PEZI|nr:hypothetical protein E0Z10_g7108 [Xylaria hypoxylon]